MPQNHSQNKIRASVTAHYLETGGPCPISTLSQRMGGCPDPDALMSCLDVHWGVGGLEPAPELYGRVLRHLAARDRARSVVRRPVRVVA